MIFQAGPSNQVNQRIGISMVHGIDAKLLKIGLDFLQVLQEHVDAVADLPGLNIVRALMVVNVGARLVRVRDVLLLVLVHNLGAGVLRMVAAHILTDYF